MSVDLASFPVLAEQAAENTLSSHPDDLAGHTSLSRTLPLTRASVTSLALCSEGVPRAGARVDDGRLRDDVTILEELLNVLAGVGIADLSLLSGVEPDFALADAGDCTIQVPQVNDLVPDDTISNITNRTLQVVFGRANS